MEILGPALSIAIGIFGIISPETKKDEYKMHRDGKPIDINILGKKINVFRLIVISVSVFMILGGIEILLRR